MTKRIQIIANLIENADLVVDVGSDHAQLSILLISQNKCQKVINIEKNLKPFENSVNNTKQFGDKITNILSDGFQKIDKNIVLDYVVIAGMGAKTMVDIICKCENKINNIIFCPNNNDNLIRQFAYNNFYKVKKDITIFENSFYYSLIWLSKNDGIKLKTKKDFLIGNKKMKKEDSLFFSLLESKINKLENIENLKKQNKNKYKELQLYRKILKKWQ